MSIKEKAVIELIKLTTFPIKVLLAKFPNKMSKLLTELSKAIEPRDYYIETRVMPKKMSNIPLFLYNDDTLKELAIVLQGPICNKDNYTLETIRYYRKLYPQSKVILSTWKNQGNIINEIESLGAIVVESADVKNPGVVNTNRQKFTTLRGIEKAKELGAKYVAKTRTDQCLRRPHVFQFMLNLLKEFPVSENSQKERIIVLPTICAGDVFYPYTFGDYFFMGRIEDMYNLWNFPDDTNPERPIMQSKREQSKYCNEGTMIRNYLDKIKSKHDFTIKDHWEILKNYFICLDNGIVNLHYAKNDSTHIYSKSVNQMQSEYAEDDNEILLKTENFGFVNWLNLYYDSMKYNKSLETNADSPLW